MAQPVVDSARIAPFARYNNDMTKITTVDDYFAQFTGETRSRLDTMRGIIHEEAPDAVEAFSYGLVGYKLNGKPLVYFGGFAYHIGFYATPNGHEVFAEDFAKYKPGKGSVQFPLDQPLPVDLIRRVVRYRIKTIEPN